MIREEEPPRPSARLSTSETLASIAATRRTEPAELTKLVRGELDWIVMKCLEKERSRRYETANGAGPRPGAVPARRRGRSAAAECGLSPAKIDTQTSRCDQHRVRVRACC